MESLWHVQDAQRNARIVSYLDHAPEPAWSSGPAKLGEGGPMKRSCFCDSSPEPKPDRCHQCCGRSVEQAWRLRWGFHFGMRGSKSFRRVPVGFTHRRWG